MDTSDVLLAARDTLRENGWRQGSTVTADGGRCLLGALDLIEDTGVDIFDAVHRLERYCREQFDTMSVPRVNDRMLTSEDEACDLLEAAAKWDGGTDG